jgi:hypothetical protein
MLPWPVNNRDLVFRHIASYLGITPAFLSMMRKHKNL